MIVSEKSFLTRVTQLIFMMDCDAVSYPCVRKEVIGSYGEVLYSLVDIRTGQVVASWVEREEGAVWGRDCYSIDENENPSEPSEERVVDPYSVYVGNLDPRVTKEDLVTCFAVVGEILRVTLLRSRKRGLSGKNGSAFIRYIEPGAAERALLLDRSCLRGTRIIVREKLIHDDGVGRDVKEDSNIDPLSVFIGNLDRGVTSLDLSSYFHQLGVIDKVTILRNRETGEHKGAAYIQFREQGGMERALSQDGCFIAGKNVKIMRKRKTTGAEDTNNNKKRRTESSDDDEGGSSVLDVSSIYVGNLDPRSRKNDLKEHFRSTGDIVRVSILKGNKAAYIQFRDEWSVEGALCMDGTMLMDKEIRVKRKMLKATKR